MPTEPRPDRSFLRSAGVVAALTMVSRVLGLARDAATSWLLGADLVSDALALAWTVPNAFRRLFGEGALGSAFVPVFTRVHQQEGLARAREVANTIVSSLLVFLLVLSALLVVAAGLLPESWVLAFAGTDHHEKAGLALDYTRLLLPYLALICVIAQLMAVLNALREFAVPALSPVILNVVWLVGIGVAAAFFGSADGDDPRRTQGYVICVAILVASLFQLAWHFPRMAALGVGFRLVRPRITPEMRELGRLMGPMLLGMGSSQISLIVDRLIAFQRLPDGGTYHLYQGLRLMHFPLGLVTAALVTAVFPALARLAVRDDRPAMLATTSLALRTNLLISGTAGAGLLALATPIVALLMQGGHFDADDTWHTARALLGYALGIPFAGTVMLLTRACYAVGELRLPVRVGLIGVAVNVALDFALVGPLQELGLSLATTLTALLTSTLLLLGLRRRLGLRPHERLLRGAWATLLLCALMGLLVGLLDAWLLPHVPGGKTGAGLRVAAGMAAAFAFVALLAPRLCADEWRELSALWRRTPEDGPPDDGPPAGTGP